MATTRKRALVQGAKCGDENKKWMETEKTDGSSREENRVGIGSAPLARGVAVPLLEKDEMLGWFHLPTDFVDHATLNEISTSENHKNQTMTWNMARKLAESGHAICSHTCSHRRLNSQGSNADIKHEIRKSYMRIASELGRPPLAFCWPGGEEYDYDERALFQIASLYRFAFASFPRVMHPGDSPLSLSRTNIEVNWSINDIKLSIGWLWALKHARKARKYMAKVARVPT